MRSCLRPYALLPLLASAAIAGIAIAGCAFGADAPPDTSARTVRRQRVNSSETRALRGLNMDPRFGEPCEAGHASIAQLQYLGITRVRIHPVPRSGESEERMISAFKEIVDNYRAHGMHVLVVLNEETFPGAGGARVGDWARSDPQRWASYKHKFASGAAKFAKALGSEVAYEVWNEPDDYWRDDGSAAGTFTPPPPADGDKPAEEVFASKHLYPDQFAEIVTSAAAAIHKEASNARVISGGVSSGSPEYVGRMGAHQADELGVHFYNIWGGSSMDNAPPGPWNSTTGFKVYEYKGVAGSRDLGNGNHRGRGLYLTEWGTRDIGVQGTVELIETFFSDSASYDFEEAYIFGWCDCQDMNAETGTGTAQSFTKDGRVAYPEIWKSFRIATGVANDPLVLDTLCRPDAALSCEHDGDKGCFIAANFVCEKGGNHACGGIGPTTHECDHCCEIAAPQDEGQYKQIPESSEECHCKGTAQDGFPVDTKTCDDTTCSTDGQLWICRPGSEDYQPTGDFSSCAPSTPEEPQCKCYGTNQDGDDVSTSTCDDTTCSTDSQLWICRPGSEGLPAHRRLRHLRRRMIWFPADPAQA